MLRALEAGLERRFEGLGVVHLQQLTIALRMGLRALLMARLFRLMAAWRGVGEGVCPSKRKVASRGSLVANRNRPMS